MKKLFFYFFLSFTGSLWGLGNSEGESFAPTWLTIDRIGNEDFEGIIKDVHVKGNQVTLLSEKGSLVISSNPGIALIPWTKYISLRIKAFKVQQPNGASLSLLIYRNDELVLQIKTNTTGIIQTSPLIKLVPGATTADHTGRWTRVRLTGAEISGDLPWGRPYQIKALKENWNLMVFSASSSTFLDDPFHVDYCIFR